MSDKYIIPASEPVKIVDNEKTVDLNSYQTKRSNIFDDFIQVDPKERYYPRINPQSPAVQKLNKTKEFYKSEGYEGFIPPKKQVIYSSPKSSISTSSSPVSTSSSSDLVFNDHVDEYSEPFSSTRDHKQDKKISIRSFESPLLWLSLVIVLIVMIMLISIIIILAKNKTNVEEFLKTKTGVGLMGTIWILLPVALLSGFFAFVSIFSPIYEKRKIYILIGIIGVVLTFITTCLLLSILIAWPSVSSFPSISFPLFISFVLLMIFLSVIFMGLRGIQSYKNMEYLTGAIFILVLLVILVTIILNSIFFFISFDSNMTTWIQNNQNLMYVTLVFNSLILPMIVGMFILAAVIIGRSYQMGKNYMILLAIGICLLSVIGLIVVSMISYRFRSEDVIKYMGTGILAFTIAFLSSCYLSFSLISRKHKKE